MDGQPENYGQGNPEEYMERTLPYSAYPSEGFGSSSLSNALVDSATNEQHHQILPAFPPAQITSETTRPLPTNFFHGQQHYIPPPSTQVASPMGSLGDAHSAPGVGRAGANVSTTH